MNFKCYNKLKVITMYKFINQLYWQRDPQSNKSDYGRCLIIAGSKKYPGASFIATKFAELAGPGYVALAVPESIYQAAVTMISPNSIHEDFSLNDDFIWDNNLTSTLNVYNAILFGNGINASLSNVTFLENLLKYYEGNLVIDGTGLRLVANNKSLLENINPRCKVLLTPHLGEAQALLNVAKKSRNVNDYVEEAKQFADKYGITILLKSYADVLVSPSNKLMSTEYVEIAGLAKAGSGDALAGLITGYLAYALKFFAYDDIISYADDLFHLVGLVAEQKYSAGLLNYNILSKILEKTIRSAKTEEKWTSFLKRKKRC